MREYAMPLIIPLLAAIGIFCDGLGHLIDALSSAGFFSWLGSIEWSAMLNWFRSASVPAPQLSSGNEALYTQFQQLMDTQFQIGELKRHMLTMPALPNEGY
jgi:hypothetical protein